VGRIGRPVDGFRAMMEDEGKRLAVVRGERERWGDMVGS
jgi:hypothetical protein